MYKKNFFSLTKNLNGCSLNIEVIELYKFAQNKVEFEKLFGPTNPDSPKDISIPIQYSFDPTEYNAIISSQDSMPDNDKILFSSVTKLGITAKYPDTCNMKILSCKYSTSGIEGDSPKIDHFQFLENSPENMEDYFLKKSTAHENFEMGMVNNTISVKLNYPNPSTAKVHVQPQRTSPVDGKDFDFPKAYNEAGLVFNPDTNTITIDRIKLMKFIKDNKDTEAATHPFEQFSYPKINKGKLYVGLQFDSSAFKDYNDYSDCDIINFKKLSGESDNPIMYIPVVDYRFHDTEGYIIANALLGTTTIRSIWRKGTEGSYEYSASEATIKVELKSDEEEVTLSVRPKGQTDENDLSDGEPIEDFDFPAEYENAGMTFNRKEKTIEVDRETMQDYLNKNREKFLHFCQPVKKSDISIDEIFFGLTFSGNEYEGYTHFIKDGLKNGNEFVETEFTPLPNAPIQIPIGRIIFDNEKHYIRQYCDESFYFSYILRKNDGDSYAYKEVQTTIYVKTKTQLSLDFTKVKLDGTGITENNGRISLDVPSLKTYLNSKMNNFDRNQDNTLGIFTYRAQDKILTLDIPYLNLKYPYENAENTYSAIKLTSLFDNFEMATYYPFDIAVPNLHGYSIRDDKLIYNTIIIAQMSFSDDGSFHLQKINGNAEEFNAVLLDPLNYASGEWSVIIPPYNDINLIDIAQTCTDGQGHCQKCDDAKTKCQTCDSGYQVDSIGKCIDQNNGDDDLSGGEIAGIVIACVVVVAAVVAVLVYFLVIKKKNHESVGEQQDVEL